MFGLGERAVSGDARGSRREAEGGGISVGIGGSSVVGGGVGGGMNCAIFRRDATCEGFKAGGLFILPGFSRFLTPKST